DDVAEVVIVVAFLQAIRSGALFIRPAHGEVGQLRNFVVDNGIFPHGWADEGVTGGAQRVENFLQRRFGDDDLRPGWRQSWWHEAHSCAPTAYMSSNCMRVAVRRLATTLVIRRKK